MIPNQSGQEKSAASIRHQAYTDEDLTKERLLGRDDHVTREGVVAAHSDGMTVDAGDDGDGQVAHCKDGRIDVLAQRLGDIEVCNIALARRRQIRTGAKGFACAGENHNARAVLR